MYLNRYKQHKNDGKNNGDNNKNKNDYYYYYDCYIITINNNINSNNDKPIKSLFQPEDFSARSTTA